MSEKDFQEKKPALNSQAVYIIEEMVFQQLKAEEQEKTLLVAEKRKWRVNRRKRQLKNGRLKKRKKKLEKQKRKQKKILQEGIINREEKPRELTQLHTSCDPAPCKDKTIWLCNHYEIITEYM